MSTIRRQSIISSGIVYIGFVLGFVNTYLFAREHGGFTPTEYGLTGLFMAIANIMYSFACLGMQAYIQKFYPYYNDNLEPPRNDMMSWALLVSIFGFVLVIALGIGLKDLVIRKFGAHSAELVKYYYWIFPFGFGLTIYSLLEAFAWQLRKSVLTNSLREILFRSFTTILILLSVAGFLTSFSTFIKIYAFAYLFIASILLAYLVITRKIHMVFIPSRVTRKFFKKILTLVALVWSGGLVYNISSVFAMIVIAAVVPDGLAFAGVYALAQNIASIIQAPQRGIISASIGPLSQAWKDKDYTKISRIYRHSSINQLVFAVGLFVLIWINFTDGVVTFHLQKGYLEAKYVFLFIGLMRIVDMGTGLNSQVIGTSVFWRFDFFTGIVLVALTLPLNYVLAKRLGVIGPAIADLFTFAVYNGIRYFFLLRKFNMQPFGIKSLYTLLIGGSVYAVCHFLFAQHQGFTWIVLRSAVFACCYLGGVILAKLTPDLLPVWETLKNKTGMHKMGNRR